MWDSWGDPGGESFHQRQERGLLTVLQGAARRAAEGRLSAGGAAVGGSSDGGKVRTYGNRWDFPVWVPGPGCEQPSVSQGLWAMGGGGFLGLFTPSPGRRGPWASLRPHGASAARWQRLRDPWLRGTPVALLPAEQCSTLWIYHCVLCTRRLKDVGWFPVFCCFEKSCRGLHAQIG